MSSGKYSFNFKRYLSLTKALKNNIVPKLSTIIPVIPNGFKGSGNNLITIKQIISPIPQTIKGKMNIFLLYLFLFINFFSDF